MKTLKLIITTAILMPIVASANVYEDRLKEAFDGIISAVSIEDLSQMHTIYTDPETGVKEGQLDVYKFTIDSEYIHLINYAKLVYEQISDDLDKELISKSELYTLWWTNDNSISGYRLYYSPEHAINVGIACDYSYTVGFLPPGDTKHRKTYTIEWDEDGEGNRITGRLITTYAPVKPKVTDGLRISSALMSPDDYDKYMEQFQAGMEKYQQGMEKYQSAMEKAEETLSGLSDGKSRSFSFSSSSSSSSSSHRNAQDWMKKLLFYAEKLQDNSSAHYIYLSKLYELCKDTEGLDQTDLKIGMQQLASIYKQLKGTNELKESELLFLESMVDLLQSKIKN